MASPFVVLSHGVGACEEMIRVSSSRMAEWCGKHGLDFHCSTQREAEGYHLYWDKIAYIRRMLQNLPDGTEVLWLDADAVPVRTDVSPRDVLPTNLDIGMRWITYEPTGESFFQAGVILMRNSIALRELIERTWELRDHPDCNHTDTPPPEDEWALNRAIQELQFPVFFMEAAWNAFREGEYDIIRAFHGWKHERVKEKLADEKLRSVRRLNGKVG